MEKKSRNCKSSKFQLYNIIVNTRNRIHIIYLVFKTTKYNQKNKERRISHEKRNSESNQKQQRNP